MLSVEDLLEILSQSDKLAYSKLISLILNMLGYSVLPNDKQLNTEIDLICRRNLEALIVSVKPYQLPMSTDIIVMSSFAKKDNANALIVTGQTISYDLRKNGMNERVNIWDLQDLTRIMHELPSLPSLESYIVKVKEGRFKGYFGVVTLQDFEKRRVLVKILNYPHQPIAACNSVHIQPLNLKPDSRIYHNFISNVASIIYSKEDKFDRVQTVTDESEYNNVPLLIRYINVGVYFDTNDSFDLIG
jgi:hypothetical protein